MQNEILNLVDEQDNLIGQVARADVHAKGLWHQRATVFVFNSKNELLIQQRASNMSWPNTWCGSASGHVLFNETYEQAAHRELKEEIGIDCKIKLIGKIIEKAVEPGGGDIENEQHTLFACHSDGPFNIQQSELSQVKFESLANIQKQISAHPPARNDSQAKRSDSGGENFTPGFIQEFEFYLKKLKS